MDFVRSQLYKNTYTKTRLQHRLGVLRHVLERVLYTNEHQESRAEAYQSELAHYANPDDYAVLSLLGTSWLTEITEASLPHFFETMTEDLESASLFTVYVPMPFDEASEAVLGSWCRSAIATDVLLELVVDRETLGGCGFIHQDTYHEYSLRTGLQSDSSVITDVVNTYA